MRKIRFGFKLTAVVILLSFFISSCDLAFGGVPNQKYTVNVYLKLVDAAAVSTVSPVTPVPDTLLDPFGMPVAAPTPAPVTTVGTGDNLIESKSFDVKFVENKENVGKSQWIMTDAAAFNAYIALVNSYPAAFAAELDGYHPAVVSVKVPTGLPDSTGLVKTGKTYGGESIDVVITMPVSQATSGSIVLTKVLKDKVFFQYSSPNGAKADFNLTKLQFLGLLQRKQVTSGVTVIPVNTDYDTCVREQYNHLLDNNWTGTFEFTDGNTLSFQEAKGLLQLLLNYGSGSYVYKGDNGFQTCITVTIGSSPNILMPTATFAPPTTIP